MKETVREEALKMVRQLIVALVTSGIILAVLIIGFASQTQREQELAEQTLFANLAQACVLSLPVDPDAGRDNAHVKECFTQYGLQAPSITGG